MSRATDPVSIVYTADEVWASAHFANRKNKGYCKTDQYNDKGRVVKHRSLSLALECAQTESYSKRDLKIGREAREWFKRKLFFKTLGNSVSEFDRAILDAADRETFDTANDRPTIALICSQIQNYLAGVKGESLETLDTVYSVGERSNFQITPLKVIYSVRWSTYYVDAIADNKFRVLFPFGEKLEVNKNYSIKGTVKAHDPDKTRLNRVKLI